MKLFFPLVSTALLASLASTQPIHGHHVHKRQPEAEPAVVTVVVTEVVTTKVNGPSPSSSIETSSSLIVSSIESSVESSASFPSSTLKTSYYSSSNIPSSSTSSSSTFLSSSSTPSTFSSSSSSSSTSSSTSTSTGSISFAEGAKGITYSPYTNSGTCKDESTIKSDIALLSQFDIIRLYDTDCSGVEAVLSAKSSSQKLFAGIYYLDKISASVSILKSAVEAVDGGWDNIYTVSVGNELVNAGSASTSDIKSAIDETRSALTSAGYSGTVVSVDTLVAVQNNPVLCDYSDFIAVNSHPFWDGNVEPSGSGSFLKTQISNIKSICGGSKDVLITETGWPTQGSTYGDAVPSIDNQATAVEAIVSEVGDQVLLFTTYNDLWKDAGSYGVEKYWGLIQD